MNDSAAIQRLLDAARKLVEDRVAHSETLVELIRETAVGAPRLGPRRLPACRHWESGLALAPDGDSIAEALAPIAGLLHWVQNPNYTTATMGPGYMDNYAYANLVGPRGLLGGNDYALGVLLLGPGLTYPPHSHPAEEVYYVVGGTAAWRRGDGPWTRRGPGSLIHHPSGQIHATRVGRDPLFVFYLWWGDIETHARLINESGALSD